MLPWYFGCHLQWDVSDLHDNGPAAVDMLPAISKDGCGGHELHVL